MKWSCSLAAAGARRAAGHRAAGADGVGVQVECDGEARARLGANAAARDPRGDERHAGARVRRAPHRRALLVRAREGRPRARRRRTGAYPQVVARRRHLYLVRFRVSLFSFLVSFYSFYFIVTLLPIGRLQ